MNNNVLVNKLSELYLRNYDIATVNNIKLIIKKIEFIESQIELTKCNKPFFFEINNMKIYKERLNKLEELKDMLYQSLCKEIS